jgi:hypothetical protein
MLPTRLRGKLISTELNGRVRGSAFIIVWLVLEKQILTVFFPGTRAHPSRNLTWQA